MSFSTEWEARFAAGKNWSLWPWSDVVSYVSRYAKPYPGMRVLELGCAVGANVPFFLAAGAEYYGVEGSATAAEQLTHRFPNLAGRIAIADFTRGLPVGEVDVVLDRSAVTHNSLAAIVRTIQLVFDALKPGGWYFGIDWFSTSHSDAGGGTRDADDFTRKAFASGQFSGVGRVHFSDESHMRDLFKGFKIELLEEKTVERREPLPHHVVASWMIAARKP